jgi:hypothetical protein
MWLTHEEWKPIADAVNPTLAVVTSITPWLVRPPPIRLRRDFYLQTAIALAFMYLLRALEHSTYALGPRLGVEHYSSHTGFAVVMLTMLAVWRWWFVLPGIAILCGYSELMIYQHYHTLTDIVATTTVICPATILVSLFRLPHSPALEASAGSEVGGDDAAQNGAKDRTRLPTDT